MPDRVYRPNSSGFRDLALSPKVREALARVCEKAKGHAEEISADIRSDQEHQHYNESFEVRPETVEWAGEHPGPRAAARLQNTAPHAAAVEYGYKGRAAGPTDSAHRVLGRTLEWLEADGR